MLKLHRTSVRPRRVTARSGFSLVELLVSITIFIILATLALSAFRDSKHDKVASASRQISASIGGARSRASKAVEPRGVRLLRDKQDYRLISGLQYVGQSQLMNGTLRVQINNTGEVWLACAQPGDWRQLFFEGLLQPGAKIRVPNNETGRWYTIANSLTGFKPQGEDLDDDWSLDPGEDLDGDSELDPQRVQIVGPIDGMTWNQNWNSGAGAYELLPYALNELPDPSAPNRSNTGPPASTEIPYLLRLSPQELPDAEPINLPPGVVIDLPSSHIPDSWKTFEDANLNGTLDANEDDGVPSTPYLPNPLDNGNGILDIVNADIPVSPNGTVGGAISGSGPIYLYVCTREDVDRMRSIAGYSPTKIPGDFENGNNGAVAPYTADFPSSERKLVCIIPQTGLVYMAEVDGRDANTDGWADDPYSFARAGREGR